MVKMSVPGEGEIEVSKDDIKRLSEKQKKHLSSGDSSFVFRFKHPSYKQVLFDTRYAGYLIEYVQMTKKWYI